PAPARQAELFRLLRDDCGACHGMTLQGGLGSPLTAAALADKPRDGLVATVLQGRPGTAMPPWQPFMTQDEA
ncbi:MAG TPA: cytochrome C55X NirC, partial [Cupriavidus sp.]|nr:cytochrome C55X NirC [Cupriavidus sp.]